MKRIIGGTLVALAIASGSMVLPAVAGATTAPHVTDDVHPFLWGLEDQYLDYFKCIDEGDKGIRDGRWRAYNCEAHEDGYELWVDYI